MAKRTRTPVEGTTCIERIGKAFHAVVDLEPGINSKGVTQCPNCHGELMWVRQHNGQLWITCMTPDCVAIGADMVNTRPM